MLPQIIIDSFLYYQEMNQAKQQVLYRFVLPFTTNYGQAVYLSGSIGELGLWDQNCALRMKNDQHNVWSIQVLVPIQVEIEYKYFIGPYERKNSIKGVNWIGDENSRLKIRKDMVSHFGQDNRRQLKIMSFNVRFQNKNDRGDYSWQNRKQNCSQLILQVFPDIIGVQQPRTSQRVYLASQIGQYYNYFGKPRDLKDDEQSGIFVRKDKFKVIQDGYIWINQDKREGVKGFGARLPRYYTYLVIHPIDKSSAPFAVINTHLDHEVEEAKLQGTKYMSQTIKQLASKYTYLRNFFVTGDFNTSDDNQIFKYLVHRDQRLGSLRYMLPKESSDFGATFNGFSKVLKYVDKTMKFFNLDPGATIDHIFVSLSDYQPTLFQCIRREEKIISDHYPIVGHFHAF